MNIFFICLIVSIFLVLYLSYNGNTNNEYFNNFKNVQYIDNSFDIMSRDSPVVYENNIINNNPVSGAYVCSKNNTGTCIEQGHTGVAYYYPDKMPTDKYFGELLNDHPEQNNRDILSFPNLR